MNRGTDSVISVYSDARAEYTKQLCVFLVPAYFQFFTDLLERAKASMINEPRRILWQFQNLLNEIHDWNMEKVNNEIHTIYTNCGCDYLDDLLTAVFIAHTKVLTAIRLSSNNKKVEINIPKVEHFLFKVLCETAKLLWSSTYLFRDGIPGIERQQNYRSIEQLINDGILQAIRGLVPVKSILKDFVNKENGDDDSDNSDDENLKSSKNISELEIPIKEEITIPKEANNTSTESTEVLSDITQADTIQPVVSADTIQPLIQVEPVVPVEPVKQDEPETNNQIPQTIVIDTKPSVTFGEFNAVFDPDHPTESELVYDSNEDDIPDLDILEEKGVPLSAGLDYDNLDDTQNEIGKISEDEYEVLN
jgi:hypothetical protein